MYVNTTSHVMPAGFHAQVLKDAGEPGSISDVVIALDDRHSVKVALTWAELRQLYHFLGTVIDDNLSTPKSAVVETMEIPYAELG